MPVRPVLVPLLLCSLLATGCGLLGDDGPGPREPAEELAASLQRLTLEGVPLTTDAPDQDPLQSLAEPLAEVPVSVDLLAVEEPEESTDAVTATLRWSWDLDGDVWEYEAAAPLRRDEESRDWELEWSPAVLHPELTEGDSLTVEGAAAPRGRILGAGDQPIVVDRPVLRHGVDKSQVSPEQALESARRVAELLGVDPGPYVDRVRAYGPKAFVEAIVLRADEADQVPAAYADVPGAVALEDTLPLAPTRDFAAELLGRVGEATAEIVEESQGRVRVGDLTGLSGLQLRYDEQLAGRRGLVVTASAAEAEPRELFRLEPTPGADLATTLDPGLQQRAERVLERVTGSASALVALRPSDGHVLAAADGPGSALGVSTTGQFAPGSTFKVVTALALLRAGVGPDDVLPCPATTVVDGRRFENYDDYPASGLGDVTLRTAFANSCNTAFIGARDRLSDAGLAEAASSLGLGVDHDLGFPSYFGQVPAPEGETEAAASMIGQGRVLASPLVMAAVTSSVAAGRTVVPVLLPAQPAPQAQSGPALQPAEAERLAELMRGVVRDGSGRFLADLPGDVGAKTGTAEFGEAGPDGPETHAWMVAFRDDLAVAVLVERGESGSGTAGPLLEAFLRG